MYGRMQFADYIVSCALQSLTRCLLRLRDREAEFPGCDSRLLAQQAQQLLSLWQMMQWSIGRLQHDAARRDLREIIALCDSIEAPEVRGARLLVQRLNEPETPPSDTQDAADDRAAASEAAAAGRSLDLDAFLAAFELPRKPGGSAMLRDRLGSLLQAESARWRDNPSLRQVTDRDLIEHGMLRAFERAGKQAPRLDEISARGERASHKRLKRTHRWVSHCANHLELLRPALSEAGRTRRWHLTRLAAKVEDQMELEAFAQAAVRFGFKRKTAARLEKAIHRERKHLAKQRGKLLIGAFADGNAGYRDEVAAAVEKLGLHEITLLPLEPRVG